MKITVRGAALACGALLFTAAAAAQPAPQAGAKPAAQQPPQNNQARRRAGFAPRPKPADQPAITATLGLHASGQFAGVIDPASNQLCYLLNDPAVRTPTAVHISHGTPAKPGAPVLTLQTPTETASWPFARCSPPRISLRM